ncbi:MAG TPA: DUF3341 domain-containing protein [Polyangium sp.]|nr:DUF3341 domain-containing protein [Polyangium sp.]
MAKKLPSGIVAEFDTHERIVHAAREMRMEGYRALDAFTPYPMRDLEQALGMRRSPINNAVFPIGVIAAALAYALQWWTSAVDYRLDVGGRPAHAPLAFVPICFEMSVLFAALTAVVILASWSKLPALWQPVFEVPGFERASIDRFFLLVSVEDRAFHPILTTNLLFELGALRTAPVGLADKHIWEGMS